MDIEQAEGQARIVGLDQVAERCKRDLFFLNKYVLAVNPDLITERTHRDLCEVTRPLLPGFDPIKEPTNVHLVERYNNGKIETTMSDQFDPLKNKLLILMPRGTFKSSIVTIGFTLQYILNNPNARILIDSETYSKAKIFLAEIKGHLEGNQKYRAIFKQVHGVFPDDNKKNGSVRWKDNEVDLACRTRPMKEPSITCSGIDRSINGMHFDLIIEDDLHSEKNVTNKEQIQQVIDHRKLAQSLLDPGMPRITIGTRWDYQDAYQHVLTNQRNSYNIIIRKAIEDDGTLLFPERLTNEFLEEQKRDQGNYIFSCQYFNTPVDDDTATFKQSYIKRIDWELVKDRPMNWFMAIDPSYEGEYSDYAAFILAGMDHQQEMYVRQVYRAKMNYMDIINLMFEWYAKYQPRRIALETIATQKNIQYMLNNEQKRRGVWLPVQEIKTRQNTKEERIKSLAPYYEFGRMHHIIQSNQLDDLEYELLHFPKGTHDDMIDALATVLEIATPPTGRRVDRERADRVKRAGDKPRSPVTGI
jgi:predicted phage terminase large subunit-like protein